MNNPVPTPEHKGFVNLSHSAQCLFFHLWMRAEDDAEEPGWLGISLYEAKTVREQIGASEEDVRALMRNGFLKSKNGRAYLATEVEWCVGPIEVENGTEVVRWIFPGTRREFMRQSLERYRQMMQADEGRYGE